MGLSWTYENLKCALTRCSREGKDLPPSILEREAAWHCVKALEMRDPIPGAFQMLR